MRLPLGERVLPPEAKNIALNDIPQAQGSPVRHPVKGTILTIVYDSHLMHRKLYFKQKLNLLVFSY
jgi:hypothetical protein